MTVAERLSGNGRSRNTDEMDEDKILRRTRSARNHLQKLTQIANQLDAEDFNAIRESLTPMVEAFQKVYDKAHSKPVAKAS